MEVGDKAWWGDEDCGVTVTILEIRDATTHARALVRLPAFGHSLGAPEAEEEWVDMDEHLTLMTAELL